MIAKSYFKRKKKNRYTAIRSAKGVEKNLLVKKCLKKIDYAPDVISFSFCLQQDSPFAPDCKNAPVQLPIVKNGHAPEIENPAFWEDGKFVRNFLGSSLSATADFKVDQPNFIHISRGSNPI